MKRWILPALLTIALIPLQAQYTKDNLRVDLSPEILKMFTYQNLMLVPVRATPQFNRYFANLGDYTLLPEAIGSDKVDVKEVSASGTVNTLVAVNRSSDTIFVMAGEVVKGGKQDRIIAQNLLINPGDSINLSAFCVEHGRWSGDDVSYGYSAGSKVAEFDEVKGVSAQSVRKIAVKEKNQQAVWSKVAEVTDKNKAGTSTGTYTALYNNEEYMKNMEGYTNQLGKVFDGKSDVIGFIAVTGDTVLGCDLFATHDLFLKAYPSLLQGYVAEAITTGAKISIDQKEVEAYISQLLDNEEDQARYLEENGAVFQKNGMKLQLTSF